MTSVEPISAFQTTVYTARRLDFLPALQKVGGQYLMAMKSQQCDNPIYPICQTQNFFGEPDVAAFCQFIKDTAFAILDDQGYDMRQFTLNFSDMWVQEHRTGSGHDRHVHAGNVISGFYFIQAPPNSSRPIFYDPRPAKEFGYAFPQKNPDAITAASDMINIEPFDGMFVFSNSWLHHSFSRNESADPFVLVHFDLHAAFAPPTNQKPVIIV
jgi:uncharacterized protein (TIGR02466 family)